MERVHEWLKRSKSMKPETAQFRTFRAILPGHQPAGFNDGIVKVEPLGGAPTLPGATDPAFIAALRFLDSAPVGLGTAMLASDLGALLALSSDRRVEIAIEFPVAVQGRPPTEMTFLPLGSVLDRRARGPFAPTMKQDFLGLLQRIPSLTEKDGRALGTAIQLHYAALVLAERDPRAAYVLVVAGLEVLSRAYGNPPGDWKAWEQSTAWDKVTSAAGMNEAQAAAVRDELMRDRHLRLKATFKAYVTEKVPQALLDTPWEQWQYDVQITNGKAAWGKQTSTTIDLRKIVPNRALLGAAVAKSYDLRSDMVHAGDEGVFFDMAVKPDTPLEAGAAVPYALLRQILRAIILVELHARAPPQTLPDIRVQ